jgi:formylglycine-generating enzyme required for sulfatase activity
MDQDKRLLKVFLCHAHSDRDTVRELYAHFKKDGIDAWLDKEKLLPGQDWDFEIRKAVGEADVVVVCLSKQFTQEGFRQKEVQLALETAMEKHEGEIFVIPARLEECDIPENLTKWHWVDLFEENGYEMLLRSLKARADKIGARLLGRRSKIPKYIIPQPASTKQLPEKTPRISEFVPVRSEEDHRASQPLKAGEIKMKKEKTHMPNTAIIVALIGLIGTIIAGLLSSPLAEKWFGSAVGQSSPATLAISPNSSPLITPRQTFSTGNTNTISVDMPAAFTDAFDTKMVLVPRGDFIMGSDNGEPEEMPAHPVYLDHYYIDAYEVTNAQYKICVDEGNCTVPYTTIDFDDLEYEQHPVVFVYWESASNFCKWRGARLPTEAEWEKAARGSDGQTYPWGEGINETYANYDKYVAGGKTTPVGLYESGISVYGAYDMAGNVWEWVEDWYAADYYAISPSFGPSGPRTGDYRVVRGGAFDKSEEYVRTFSRTYYDGKLSNSSIGFRCARDADS